MKRDKVYNNKCGFEIPPEHIPSNEEMQRLFDGDETVIPVLIEGLTGFTIDIVSYYLGRIPSFRQYEEDLNSEALCKLCEFTQGKLGKKSFGTKFMGQLAVSVNNCLNDWTRENINTITIPAREQRRSGATLVRHEIKESHLVTDNDEVFNAVWTEHLKNELNDQQIEVLRLRMDEYSCAGIAQSTGLHRSVVARILIELETIFEGEIL